MYLKGSRKPESKSSLSAVIAAVQKSTGGTNIESGGTLTLTYTGDGQPSRRGWNAPKQYEASYTPPSPNVDLAGGGQTQADQGSQNPNPAQQQNASAQGEQQPPAMTPEVMAALAAAGVQLPNN